MQGAERMGGLASELAANEAKLRGEQELATSGLRVQALTGAGQIEAAHAQASAMGGAGRAAAKLGEQRLAWEKEKFKEYQFPMQQQDQAWSNMFSLYGMQNEQQNRDWDRYADML